MLQNPLQNLLATGVLYSSRSPYHHAPADPPLENASTSMAVLITHTSQLPTGTLLLILNSFYRIWLHEWVLSDYLKYLLLYVCAAGFHLFNYQHVHRCPDRTQECTVAFAALFRIGNLQRTTYTWARKCPSIVLLLQRFRFWVASYTGPGSTKYHFLYLISTPMYIGT